MKERFTDGESNLAWFKLAELITRGEKEKVLSFYRLLSHSFTERAYALQVEGDILWSFNDPASMEKYEQAVFLYQREGKTAQALSLSEHMLSLSPDHVATLLKVLLLTTRQDMHQRFEHHWRTLVDLWQSRKIVQAVMERTVLRVAAEIDQCEDAGRTLTNKRFSELATQVDERLGRFAGRALQR